MKAKEILITATIVAPFSAIAVAAILYPGFSLYYNALSDLGHALKSPSAPIFNLGLTVTSFLLAIQAVTYLWRRDRALSAALISVAFFLQLVAVYDEVYGTKFDHLHFIVSALFFIAIIVFLLLYAVRQRSVRAAGAAIAAVVIWAIHFVADFPPGAAIPELVSVLLFLPVYVELMFKS